MDPAGELAELLEARASCSPASSRISAAAVGSLSTRARARRICRETATRRCWAPSCRSRSRRRRAASPAPTIRVRDAASSRRASAPASARATSSAKLSRRCSAFDASGSSRWVAATSRPQTRPATTTGAATTERYWPSRGAARDLARQAGVGVQPPGSCRCAARCSRACRPRPAAPSRGRRRASRARCSGRRRSPTRGSRRSSAGGRTRRRGGRLASSVTSRKTSLAGGSRATSVATRRSAACSAARRERSSRRSRSSAWSAHSSLAADSRSVMSSPLVTT